MMNLTPFYNTFYLALKNSWPMLTLFVAIMVIIKISHVLINHERIVFYKEFYTLLAIIYFLMLYYLLLSTENASSGINLIPFKEMTRYSFGSKLFLYNVVGNIVLFISFGIFISDYLKAKRISHILFVSALISLTAELIQYKIGRAFDVDDIILNVVGAVLGFLFYICIQAVKSHLPKFLQNNIFYNIVAVIVLIIVVTLFGSIWGLKV